MTDKLSKNFRGVGVGPLSNILAVIIVCLNNHNEKVILKRFGGNFELIEIMVQFIIKKNLSLKIIYLYSMKFFIRLLITNMKFWSFLDEAHLVKWQSVGKKAQMKL